MTLDELNALSAPRAEDEFLRCCGSRRWAQAMAAERPFRNAHEMAVAADRVWQALDPPDWLEAFAAHPRIGERGTGGWPAEEQSGTHAAAKTILERLAHGNREYEARFGHVFLICATGKSAGEMLTSLERRLRNDHDTERRTAADEQRQITALRLGRLVTT